MEFRNVKFEKRDSVGYITLNNPEKRNPINIDTHRELRECFDLCDYDDEIRGGSHSRRRREFQRRRRPQRNESPYRRRYPRHPCGMPCRRGNEPAPAAT